MRRMSLIIFRICGLTSGLIVSVQQRPRQASIPSPTSASQGTALRMTPLESNVSVMSGFAKLSGIIEGPDARLHADIEVVPWSPIVN